MGMSFCVIALGKLREPFFRAAADEYLKRCRRYGAIEEIELPDLPEPSHDSAALVQQVLDKEAESILARVKPSDYVIALAIEGKQLDSLEMSAHLSVLQASEAKRIVFIIGGSLGLGQAVLARANERLSLSRLTFPHQMARVMLLEQLYRSCKIAANERYHK